MIVIMIIWIWQLILTKPLKLKKKTWEEMQIMNILVNKILFDSLRNKLADDG